MINKGEIKRRVNHRMDEDFGYKIQVNLAFHLKNEVWMSELVSEVVGFIIEIGSEILKWLIEYLF